MNDTVYKSTYSADTFNSALKIVKEQTANVWDSTKQYTLGTYVWLGLNLYYCNVAQSTLGTFVSSEWQEAPILFDSSTTTVIRADLTDNT